MARKLTNTKLAASTSAPRPSLQRILNQLPRHASTFIQPMQPETARQLPTGDQWQYELKWDGYRVIAVKRGDEVKVYSRTRPGHHPND